MSKITDLEQFTASCFEAAEFTDFGEDCGIPSNAEWSEETRLDLEAECRSWWRRFGCYVLTDVCENVGSEGPIAQAGHDFWLTRNGHGAGFWDGDWPEAYEKMFTKGAESYGDFTLYLGDDGKVYA
jgi:hypothetical protein